MAPRQIASRSETDRRRLPRVRTGASIRMTVAADGEGLVLVNLSHAGCAVETRRAFRPGEELYLTFTLDTCLSFVVPVRVVYARPARRARTTAFQHLVGLEFAASRQPDIHRVVEILLEASDETLSVH
jgi:Tfp pilus assembly protein PilZ